MTIVPILGRPWIVTLGLVISVSKICSLLEIFTTEQPWKFGQIPSNQSWNMLQTRRTILYACDGKIVWPWTKIKVTKTKYCQETLPSKHHWKSEQNLSNHSWDNLHTWSDTDMIESKNNVSPTLTPTPYGENITVKKYVHNCLCTSYSKDLYIFSSYVTFLFATEVRLEMSHLSFDFMLFDILSYISCFISPNLDIF